MKVNEPNTISSSTLSINVEEVNEKLHCAVAPLASSETFSDVVSISREEHEKYIVPIDKETCQAIKAPNSIQRTDDFSSLEVLLDFPSSDLSKRNQTNTVCSSASHSRIRFSEKPSIINLSQVWHL